MPVTSRDRWGPITGYSPGRRGSNDVTGPRTLPVDRVAPPQQRPIAVSTAGIPQGYVFDQRFGGYIPISYYFQGNPQAELEYYRNAMLAPEADINLLPDHIRAQLFPEPVTNTIPGGVQPRGTTLTQVDPLHAPVSPTGPPLMGRPGFGPGDLPPPMTSSTNPTGGAAPTNPDPASNFSSWFANLLSNAGNYMGGDPSRNLAGTLGGGMPGGNLPTAPTSGNPPGAQPTWEWTPTPGFNPTSGLNPTGVGPAPSNVSGQPQPASGGSGSVNPFNPLGLPMSPGASAISQHLSNGPRPPPRPPTTPAGQAIISHSRSPLLNRIFNGGKNRGRQQPAGGAPVNSFAGDSSYNNFNDSFENYLR